jgi:type IV pilus assembly protein PilA
MIQKLRERSGGEAGFTLVELLVVMLILGLLAAIAIPSFFNQRDKARDADAKTQARTAQTAIETYATDHDGEYDSDGGATVVAALKGIESTLNDATLAVDVGGGTGDTADRSYEVTATSETGNTFSVTRHNDGTTDNTCATENTAGCPDGGEWD